jgi:divalent metal cation (Fe/Co/Zn/Cd) transporter
VTGIRPDPSPSGMLWLALTVIAMLALAYGKQRTGVALDNSVLVSESRVTIVDGVLAGAVLIGLGLNALVGWWWADPVAGLVIVYYGVKEGLHAWSS